MPPSKALVARKPLIVATANPGKLREFRALLSDLPFELHGLGELGIAPPEESGASFLENAMLKARHAAAAARAAGLRGTSAFDVAAIADDSGLEVDALGGAPGIFSARYAGVGADDAANNAKLLSALAGVPLERRGARYRCALVLVFAHSDAAPLIAEGIWEGSILESPRGSGGFGYDPYFWLPELGVTAAQLDPSDKNRLSHRGIAMRALRDQLLTREQAEAHERAEACEQIEAREGLARDRPVRP
jgi:XTP/dITP diphosphohydrolase